MSNERKPIFKQQQESMKSDSASILQKPTVIEKQIQNDYKSFLNYGKAKFDHVIKEKMWRMEVQERIEQYIRAKNKEIVDSLDVKHKKNDFRMYMLKRNTSLEEDVFKYFYPFCMINCTLMTYFIFRKTSVYLKSTAAMIMAQYVYFLFSFPVESWHFHKRAVSREKPYAQMIRDSYIQKFPDSWKAKIYRDINRKLEVEYSSDLRILQI